MKWIAAIVLMSTAAWAVPKTYNWVYTMYLQEADTGVLVRAVKITENTYATFATKAQCVRMAKTYRKSGRTGPSESKLEPVLAATVNLAKLEHKIQKCANGVDVRLNTWTTSSNDCPSKKAEGEGYKTLKKRVPRYKENLAKAEAELAALQQSTNWVCIRQQPTH